VRIPTMPDEPATKVYKGTLSQKEGKMMFSPTILLLEDEALIALDVEQTLLDAGAKDIVHLGSCAAATDWLVDYTPDLVVLDIFLLDGESTDIASLLVERGIPFVVHTARRKVTQESHQVLLNGEWVCKPAEPDELARAVGRCLEQRRDKGGLGCRDLNTRRAA
jgi:DNA-binding response OmpR family regulator